MKDIRISGIGLDILGICETDNLFKISQKLHLSNYYYQPHHYHTHSTTARRHVSWVTAEHHVKEACVKIK